MSAPTLVKKIKEVLPKSVRVKLPKRIEVVEVKLGQSSLLNRIYRGHKKPTNVLSFLYSLDYGEILVCPILIREEAKKQGNSYKYQMTWMILHGMIHLAGLHHEKSRLLSEKTEELEQKILDRLFKKVGRLGSRG